MTVPPWQPPEDHREADLLGVLREQAQPLDALVIAAVPAFLVAVFAVVGSPEPPLALSHSEPAPASLLTAHFVHRSPTHLVDNLAVYALVVPTAYALALLAGRRRAFAMAFLANLLLLPPVLSGVGLLVYDRGVTLGFSGVTMAFVGLIALEAGTYLGDRLTGWGDGDPAPALFFAGVALVAIRTVSPLGPRIGLAVGAMGIAGYAVRRPLGSVRPIRRSLDGLRSDAGQFGAVAVVVLGLGLLAGFPGGAAAGSVVVNTFGHFAGFVFGFAAPYLAFRMAGQLRGTVDSPPGAV